MSTNVSLDGAQAILTYAFKDPRWKMKLLIGALLGFAGFIIPILPGIFLVGYSATIMRQIIVKNAGASLPEWDDWSTLFVRGLRLVGAMFIFFFPVFLLMIIGYFVMMGPLFLGIFSGARPGSDVSRLVGLQMLGWFGGMGLFMFGMLLSLLISFFVPPALAHQVAKDSFSAAFHVSDWWRILKANLGGFFAALVLIDGLYILLIFVVQIVYMTLILCFLLPILMSLVMIYLSVVSAAALGEAYRRGVEKLTPEPVEA